MSSNTEGAQSAIQELRGEQAAVQPESVFVESGRLSAGLASRARWTLRFRWVRTVVSYVTIIAIAAEHERILSYLLPRVGELYALAALIGISIAPYAWAEYRKIRIEHKWGNTAPRLNATMRLDCAKAYTRALRLYVNLKQVYTWILLWGAAYLYIAIVQFQSDSFSGAVVGQQTASAILFAFGLYVLWRGYVIGHRIFHPGGALVKSILWLHIQAHDPDTSASEKAEMLIEDQVKIREEHPIWYMNYVISGPRQA